MKRVVVVFCLVVGWCRAGAAAEETVSPDWMTVTNYLANACSEIHGTSNANVRVLTMDESVASIDRVFAKAPMQKFSSDRLARMKRLLKENLALGYSYDATVVKGPLAYRVDGKVSKLPVGTTFSAYAYRERLFDGGLDPVFSFSHTVGIGPRHCSGCVAWVSKPSGDVFNLQAASDNELAVLPFRVRRLETDVSTGVWEKEECLCASDGAVKKCWRMMRRARDDGEAEVIADVADVSFNSFESLNSTHVIGDGRGYAPATPVATYRVELIVRSVEAGSLDCDRIAFVVDPRLHEGLLYDVRTSWPFYRGLTVRVRLCREGNALKVACANPVSPYPPRERAICMPPECVSPLASRFALNPKVVARPKDAVAVTCLQYGDHTFAKFYSTTNDITGSFGSFPDYSRTVRVEVWVASEGADADYWKTAWFTRRQCDGIWSRRAPLVTVRNVEEGMVAETRLAFAWHCFLLSSSELSSVKTLGAFADLVNCRTVCKTCDKPHYRVVLPNDLRARALRFEKDVFGRVLDLLKSVCERTGCAYELKGTDLVLKSELSEAELVDKSLKGLLHILEKDGFASVKEADYVGLSFYKEGFPEGLELPHFRPHAFAFRSAYVTTGNGWRRKDANGKAEYLAFDAVWWPGAKDRLEGFSLYEERPRLARDVAKVRACLRDAAENPKDAGFRYQAEEMDVFALAFALHLQQRGQDKDAQSIYDALNLRPAAAEAAFAKLRRRVKLGKRQNGGK